MEKESIFFSCLTIMIIFEVGYYLLNPTQIWSLGVGAITAIISTGVITASVIGLTALTIGLAEESIRIIFFASTILTLLFRIDIVINLGGLNSIPLGIGLLHPNLTSIFILDTITPLSMFGLMIVSVIMLFTVITGLMIAGG